MGTIRAEPPKSLKINAMEDSRPHPCPWIGNSNKTTTTRSATTLADSRARWRAHFDGLVHWSLWKVFDIPRDHADLLKEQPSVKITKTENKRSSKIFNLNAAFESTYSLY